MTSALLVLDVQKIYTDPDSELCCEGGKETIAKINKLIDAFQEKGDPIYLIRHAHAPDGSDLGRMFDFAGEEEDFNFKRGTHEVEYDERLHRPRGVIEIEKTRYSAFSGTALTEDLAKRGVTRVVVCGFMTNFCCDSTAREAHDRDFYVDFITDATGTPGTDGHDQEKLRSIVSELLAEGYAVVRNADEFLDL